MSKIHFTIQYPTFIESILVYFLLRYRKKHYGYPFRKIKLTKGQYAIVDPEDYEKLIGYNWFAVEDLRTFYAQRNGNGKSIKMHRQIMNPPPGLFVDHQNHNGIDNRKANLKIATPAQNAQNRLKGRRKTSSRYKGVYFDKGTKKWRADIYHNNKATHLGYFENEEDAAKAYDKAAKIYHGDFASLNFSQVASKQREDGRRFRFLEFLASRIGYWLAPTPVVGGSEPKR